MITPPPLPARRFKFPALAVLLIAAGWGVSFLSPVQGASGGTVAGIVGYRCGQAAVLFALPLLITWVLWKLCRLQPGRTKITAWIVSAVFVFGTVGSVAKEALDRRAANNRELRNMEAEVREHRKKGLAPEASYDDLQEANRKAAEAIHESGQKMTGDEGRLMRAMSGAMQKLQARSAAYYQLAAEMEKAPVLDISTIKTLDEITRRLALVEQLRQENENLKATTLGFEEDVHEAIRTAGVSEAKQRDSWSGFQSTFGKQKSRLLEMRALDAELAGRMQHVLSLLRDEWGKWDNTESNQIRFENEHHADEYNRQIERIRAIADEEAKIQSLLSRM